MAASLGLDLVKDLEELELKPTIALFSSYTIDLAFFEVEILSALQNKNEDILALVLCDYSQYLDTARTVRSVRKAESEYRFIPVRNPGRVFHPKTHLLAGDGWARLYVGSGNLTTAGFRRNLEIYDRIDWTIHKNQYAAAFQSFGHFLEKLGEPGRLPANAGKSIARVLEQVRKCEGPPETDIEFASSLDSPLMDGLDRLLPDGLREVIICSPYHDHDSDPLIRLSRRYPHASFRFVVPHDSTPVNPQLLKTLKGRVSFARFKSENLHDRILHAKLILGIGTKSSTLIVGSPNFTGAGCLVAPPNGNVETWTIRKGSPTAFERLFKGEYILEDAPAGLPYLPLKVSPSPSPSQFVIDHASYDETVLRVTIARFPKGTAGSVAAYVSGYLGQIELKDGIVRRKEDGTGHISFSVPAAEAQKLTEPCTVYLRMKAGAQFETSEPVWIELTVALAMDAFSRRLRDSLTDFATHVQESGRPRDSRTMARMINAVSDLIRQISLERVGPIEGGGSTTPTTPKDKESGWSGPRTVVPSDEVGSAGAEHFGFLKRLAGELDRLTQRSPEQVKRLIAASYPSGDTESETPEAVPDEPWKPEADFLEDYGEQFTRMLESVAELDLKRVSFVRIGLIALECLSNLSFLIYLDFLGLDPQASEEEQRRAGVQFENDWRRLLHFCFTSTDVTSEQGEGWLVSYKLPSEQETSFQSLSFLIGTLAMISNWTFTAKQTTQNNLIGKYREMLWDLEQSLGIQKKVAIGLTPKIREFMLRVNSYQLLFSDPDATLATLAWLYDQPRRSQHISSLYGPVKRLNEIDVLLFGSKAPAANEIGAEREKIRAELIAAPKLQSLMAVYEQVKKRRKDPLVLFIIDPASTKTCPRPDCHAPIFLKTQSQLSNPTAWTQCSECDSILIGALKFLQVDT